MGGLNDRFAQANAGSLFPLLVDEGDTGRLEGFLDPGHSLCGSRQLGSGALDPLKGGQSDPGS